MCENSVLTMNWSALLNTSRQDVKNNLTLEDLDTVIDHLLQEYIITLNEKESIASKPTRIERIGQLLDILCQRGDQACFVLVEIFKRYTHMHHLWRRLNSKERLTRNIQSDFNGKTENEKSNDENENTERNRAFLDIICSPNLTLKDIRKRSFQKDLQKQYGELWKQVYKHMENMVHPLTTWLTEACAVLKTKTIPKYHILLETITNDIIQTRNDNCNVSCSFENKLEGLTQQFYFKIIFNICHAVVKKAGAVVDDCKTTEEHIDALYVLYEIVECFKNIFLRYESLLCKKNPEFPVMYKVCKLELERIGSEWFLDLDFKNYVDLEKHPSLKNLDFIPNECPNTFYATQLRSTDWKQVDNLLFDIQKSEKSNLHGKRTLSYSKILQNLCMPHTVPKDEPTEKQINHRLFYGFHFSSSEQYVLVLKDIQKRNIGNDSTVVLNNYEDDDCEQQELSYLGENNYITAEYNHTHDIMYSQSIKPCHRIAMNILYYLLKVKGFQLDLLHIETTGLKILQSEPSMQMINSNKDLYEFLDIVYTKLSATTTEDHHIRNFHRTDANCHASVCNEQFKTLKSHCGSRLTHVPIDYTLPRKPEQFPLLSQNRSNSITCNEKQNIVLDKMLLTISLMTIRILVLSSKSTSMLWEIWGHIFFYIQFGIVAYVLFSLTFCFLFMKKTILLLIGTICVIAFSHGHYHLDKCPETFYESLMEHCQNYHHYLDFPIVYHLLKAVFPLLISAILLFLYSHTKYLKNKQGLTYDSSSKDYAYYVMKEQETTRSRWMKLSLNWPFRTAIIPNIFSFLISYTSTFVHVISKIALLQCCFGPFIYKHSQGRNFLISGIFQIIPHLCTVSYYILYQQDSKIECLNFLHCCLIIFTLMYTTLVLIKCFNSNFLDLWCILRAVKNSFFRTRETFMYILLLIKLILPHVITVCVLLLECVDTIVKTEVISLTNNSLSKTPFTFGLPDHEMIPLLTIYFVTKKLQRIHSGQHKFAEEKSTILLQTLEYTDSNATHPSEGDFTSIKSIYFVLTDVLKVFVWLFTFVYSPLFVVLFFP